MFCSKDLEKILQFIKHFKKCYDFLGYNFYPFQPKLPHFTNLF